MLPPIVYVTYVALNTPKQSTARAKHIMDIVANNFNFFRCIFPFI